MNVTYTGAKQGSQSPFGGRSDSPAPETPLKSNAAKATQKTPNSVGEDLSDNSSLDERYNTPNNKKIVKKKSSKPSGLKIKVER